MKSAPQRIAASGGRLAGGSTGAIALTAMLMMASVEPSPAQGDTLKPKIVDRDSFTVIGIEVRTNNGEASTVIPRQWARFFKEGLAAGIPNRSDDNLMVVYSGYASDHHSDYDYLIGARVRDGSTTPEGMVAKQVPSGRYAMITTEQGPLGKVVSEAWRKIWTMEGSGGQSGGLGGKRAYKSDFEVYDQRSSDPNNSQVDIYIGVD